MTVSVMTRKGQKYRCPDQIEYAAQRLKQMTPTEIYENKMTTHRENASTESLEMQQYSLLENQVFQTLLKFSKLRKQVLKFL